MRKRTKLFKRVTKYFTRWSRYYDRSPLQFFLFEATHKQILKIIKPQKNMRKILDVGCGTGRLMIKLRRRRVNAQVHGLDLSVGMLQQAAKKIKGRSGMFLVQGNSQSLPFPDNTFDLITCEHSFHHYPDKTRVVEEMYRVLKPNGRLVIADGSRDTLWGFIIFGIIVEKFREQDKNVKHLTKGQMYRLLMNIGFRKIKQRLGNIFIPTLYTKAVK